ncbi:sorting nexin-22 isoform X1 [Phacochoerus africanus]|uniref:sorting nexin-22 isoform X1 n=1 Tax=Phacochoerus africanus TaxID=41426 RepID=UPI001FD8B9BE|nr:sorting nexin-22 isoform X1 [Phacochoerus africanus]
MLQVHIPSVGPEAEGTRQSPDRGHMVFRVEVLCRGRRHTVQRRYSEFHALHKRVRQQPTDRPRPAPAHPLGGGQTSWQAPVSAIPIIAPGPGDPCGLRDGRKGAGPSLCCPCPGAASPLSGVLGVKGQVGAPLALVPSTIHHADQETIQSSRLPLETPAQLEDQRIGAAAAGLGGLYPGHPILEPGCAQGTTGIPESSAPPHRPQGQQLGLTAVPQASHQLLRGPLHLHPPPRASA